MARKGLADWMTLTHSRAFGLSLDTVDKTRRGAASWRRVRRFAAASCCRRRKRFSCSHPTQSRPAFVGSQKCRCVCLVGSSRLCSKHCKPLRSVDSLLRPPNRANQKGTGSSWGGPTSCHYCSVRMAPCVSCALNVFIFLGASPSLPACP